MNHKLTKKDLVKIRARFNRTVISLKDKSLDELNEISKTKMSSTDRKALDLMINFKNEANKKQVEDGTNIKSNENSEPKEVQNTKEGI